MATSRSSPLARRFEALLQLGDPQHFLHELAAHCSLSANSPWEALAVVDQLYRRRKLSPQLFQLARIGIERRALGLPETVATNADSPVAVAEVAFAPAAQVGCRDRTDRDASELQRLRAELERARTEVGSLRQHAQQLEQQLEQQHASPPQSIPAQPQRALARRAVMVLQARSVAFVRHLPPPDWQLWLIRGGFVVAGVLLLVLLPGGNRTAAQLPAAATPAAVLARPVTTAVQAPVAAQPGELAFEQDRHVVGAAQRQVVIGVRRTVGTDGEVRLEWQPAGGGAKAGRDFTLPASAVLNFRDGQSVAHLTIPILRNPLRKHTEYFDLRLVRGSNGVALGSQRRTTVFILPGAGAGRPPSGRRAGT